MNPKKDNQADDIELDHEILDLIWDQVGSEDAEEQTDFLDSEEPDK